MGNCLKYVLTILTEGRSLSPLLARGVEGDEIARRGGVDPSTQPNTRWRGSKYNVPTSFGAPKASGNKKIEESAKKSK